MGARLEVVVAAAAAAAGLAPLAALRARPTAAGEAVALAASVQK